MKKIRIWQNNWADTKIHLEKDAKFFNFRPILNATLLSEFIDDAIIFI